MTRVLVVDDSAFMRKALSKMLESDPGIQVVGTARDGIDALEKVRQLDPDLVTLDVDMPRMDGLEALRRIMAECPRPVLMVSALTEAGAEETLQALDLGALDFIPKATGGNIVNITHIERSLCQKVRVLGRRRRPQPGLQREPASAPPVAAPVAPSRRPQGMRYLAIGASTGGPPALQTLLSGLAPGFSLPVVIVQHMPKAFTGPFARRLNGLCPLEMKEAESGDRLAPGRGFVAPGGSHLVLVPEGGGLTLQVTPEPADTLHKPSVDVTFSSFADHVGRTTLAVVLTGMGSDGLAGVRELKQKGAHTITQDADSCVVYGMPRAVAEAGLSDAVLPIGHIAAAVNRAAP
ncbi:MAG TPA: chemotaxis response regulator protein-glutamate methylesterase [Deferrisomatales bacterium]|nr:chemotaxis response regulator protein-glutamate methylesterase [Deferrisomatales bacterium]